MERCRQAERTSRSVVTNIPGWAWTVGFVVLVALARAFTWTPSSPPTTGSPTRTTAVATTRTTQTTNPVIVSTPAAPPTFSVKDDLGRRLDTLKQDIEAQRPQLDRRGRALNDREAGLNELEAELNRLNSAYPSGAPPDVVSRYERLRREYNDAVANYNVELQSVQALNRSFNLKVDEYNSLLSQYRNAR